MLIRKANRIELWNYEITNWYNDDNAAEKNSYLVHRIGCYESKIAGILVLLNSPKIRTWFRVDKTYSISLNQVIKARGNALKQFFEYWHNVPSYDDVYQILNKWFSKDICNIIIRMAAKIYG